MDRGFSATASITIDAPRDAVWRAITDPDVVASYFFGTRLESTWEVGSPITWSGEWQGTQYQDHGTVLRFQPEEVLEVTHFSPLTGQPDEPENYHTLRFELSDADGGTRVDLTQDNASSQEEADHDAENWAHMLAGMKRVVEA